jgi:dipeptidyl aminopeptidase/acylaminoacyl peptidase
MPRRAITAEDLLKIQFVSDPHISPDGGRILFTKAQVDREKNKYTSQIYTVDAEGSVQQWTTHADGASSGRWSPDGKQIAFISGREKPSAQIFLLPVSGGEGRKLTNLPEGSIGGYVWSPDGKWIAFTFREQHPDRIEKAKKERDGKGLSDPPWEIDNAWYRLDGDGYFGGQRYAIYLVEVATGKHRKLYDGDPLGFYSVDWSPNSQELAVVHSANKRPLFEPANHQIYRVNLEGQAWQIEGLPKGTKGAVRWSPDGKWLAYLGQVDEEDPWGVRNTRIWIAPADGGEATCLTADDDFCLEAFTLSDTGGAEGGILEWAPDSKALYTSVGWHGAFQLGFVTLDKPGKLELLTQGHHLVVSSNISRDGERIACLYGTAMKPLEVAVYDLSKHSEEPETLTSFNRELLDELKLSEPEELWLDSDEGQVHAWVMKPLDFLPPKRYPAILEIHGGPHAQYGWSFFHEFQLLAAQGYVVVYSNPRGSKGYGEAWTAAIRGDWGNKDWQDIQTVMRWMQHQPYIHPGQMGVMGGSYGGYMTNWTISHTNDFKAAITDRCVSNLVSFGGNYDFVQREDSYWKGVFYGDISQLWANSPIAHFKNVKTPTLVIHSEGDLRCNVEQGEQVFSALQQLGVESRFVRYPRNTSHGMSRNGPPDMRLHRLGEITRWWERWLK